MDEKRFQAFFAAAMISAAPLQLGHVPALVALLASACIGVAFAAAIRTPAAVREGEA